MCIQSLPSSSISDDDDDDIRAAFYIIASYILWDKNFIILQV